MKRFFDLTIIIIFSPILFILLLSVSIIIYFSLGAPIFFIQKRIGKDNKVFQIIKFRTMDIIKDSNIINTDNDYLRIKKIGKFLRSTSLDELPEIFNVIKNEMSLVGPRPLFPEYLKLYDNHQIKRHKILPGITGLAQIKGRNNLSWKKKFEYDLIYVKNNNLYLDIKILLITFYQILLRKNISSKNHVTTKKFSGNE